MDKKDGLYFDGINFKKLGQRIKEERKKLNYTQEQVAELINVTPAFIGHIERAERSLSLETLVKICHTLNVTIDYVLADTLPQTDETVTEQLRVMLKNKTTEQKAKVFDIMSAVIRNI